MCVFFVFAGFAHAEEAVVETEANPVALEAQLETEAQQETPRWTAPDFADTDAAIQGCSVGGDSLESVVLGHFGPYCSDCAGGCSIRCSSDATCMQRCPNNVGKCSNQGRCACAC